MFRGQVQYERDDEHTDRDRDRCDRLSEERHSEHGDSQARAASSRQRASEDPPSLPC